MIGVPRRLPDDGVDDPNRPPVHTGSVGGTASGRVAALHPTAMDLHDPGTLRQFLKKHGLGADKSLGQHFLCSPRVADAIRGRLTGVAGILEIGPGPGAIASVLASEVRTYRAVELDRRFVPALADCAPAAEVLLMDVLRAPLGEILSGLPEPRAVVSNMPYNITGPLLTRIAENRNLFSKAVLMMQKEVAQRVLAPPGHSDRGSLSVFLQLQFAIVKVADVPPGAFLPPPKVDSTVLEMVPIPDRVDADLLELIRAGFRQPRKTLENNLVGVWPDRRSAKNAIAAVGLDEKVRPHALRNEDWRALTLRWQAERGP